MTTRNVLMSIVALAGFAIPAQATIAFVYCNDTSHCTSNSGMTFSTFGTAAGGLGYAMSSPITFVSAGLSATPAIYVDAGTGTTFAGYSNATTQNSVQILSTSLAQTINAQTVAFRSRCRRIPTPSRCSSRRSPASGAPWWNWATAM
jgi:hypothetical protein